MGKKAKVPEYSSATVNTGGLFGSATADKNGINMNPESWQTNLSNTITSNLTPTVNSMQDILRSATSGDYLNDANFQTYQNDFNRRAKETYDTAVLGNLADRGLMRSSGIQALNDNYSNAVRNDLTNLMDNYYNRQVNNYNLQTSNLSNLLNTQNSLYNWLMGVGNMAQNQANAVSNHNVNKAQIEAQQNAANMALWGQLANAGSKIAGSYLGG